MPDDLSTKHFSERFKKAMDELEDATAKASTLSDELLYRLMVQSGDISPDDSTDFISKS